MSQQDNFFGGFVVGTLFGGIVGGVAGAFVMSRINSGETREGAEGEAEKKKSPDLMNDSDIELARRSLEDKIALLNEAIDDVQHQLGGVNGVSSNDNGEQAIAKDL
ncbi:MAG: hypothetical protein WBA57_03815 [Elainellaceae cyanobacterium]